MKPMNNVLIPTFIEEDDGRFNKRSSDVFSALFNKRIIFLTQEINEVTAAALCAQLIALQTESRDKPVELYINCGGGSVYAGLMILNTMACVSYPIHITVMGLAASMAAIIFVAGTKGHRNIAPYSRIMVHQPHGGAQGQTTDVEIQAREMIYLKTSMTEFVAQRVGKSFELIKEMMERDRYLSAEESIELGFADKILPGDFDKLLLMSNR